VVVISKSGETTETKAALIVAEKWLRQAVGKSYGRHIVAITDPVSGSLRARVEREQKKDPLSFRSFPLLRGVGGRFSELNMGLLHLAIAGVRVGDLLAGAARMQERCASDDLFRNPAGMYACLHHLLDAHRHKHIAVMMPFSEALKSTADWYVQLLAESLGKKFKRRIVRAAEGTESWEDDTSAPCHCGRTPVPSRGTGDLHSIQQNNAQGRNDKAVTFIKVCAFRPDIRLAEKRDFLDGRSYSSLLSLAQEATAWALVREQRPNMTISLPMLDAATWGGLIYFFELATAYEGELLDINAFHQPGVEGYKHYMYYKLGKPGLGPAIAEEILRHPLVQEERFIL
jgi:glucose-6-phosphate isomerase